MQHPGEPIAIIGSACHFAGNCNTPAELWELLSHPRDVRRQIPDTRFNIQGFYHRDPMQQGHTNVAQSYLIDKDLSAFDAQFFGIKPVEAKAIDPQQRCLMETVYEGIESAGLAMESLRGSNTSVYVGVMCNDYGTVLLRDLDATPMYAATGTANSILSNRISHFFDWRGPSMTIDTACSSSLVAVHLAVQALRAGESRIAVACGSNLILGPESYVIESRLKMLSPDGICRMWDEKANGYARGDGVAAIILKRLRDALADGDHIECIIRETGVNQDGNTPGITMPSPKAQAALINDTYSKAGLDPLAKPEDRPQYFEAHGTGTQAGDPVEAQAIQEAFFGCNIDTNGYFSQSMGLRSKQPLYVGSIKTVLGHTEGTAGLAGILKVSLALQYGTIPPNLHFHKLSNRVAPFYSNLAVVRDKCRPWPPAQSPNNSCRRASINSFGFGGTNAHVILEHYNISNSISPEQPYPLFTPFVFSAHSKFSLLANLAAYSKFLALNPAINMHNLAWTLRQRRSLLPHRAYFVAQSVEDLKQQILSVTGTVDGPLTGPRSDSFRYNSKDKPGRLVGVFTGQGAQFPRVAADLIEKSPYAQGIIQSLEEHLAELSPDDRPNWSLRAEILAPSQTSQVSKAAIAQPLCTAVQILLVDLLSLAGVHFDIVIGHSSGEIAAAYAAGAISARDAICIAYFRGLHVMRETSSHDINTRGAMMAVQTSMEDAIELCKDDIFHHRIEVAASNSSQSVTISGDLDAMQELEEILKDESKYYSKLRVDTAYHSHHMDRVCAPYLASLRRCRLRSPSLAQKNTSSRKCRWFSTVYNRPIDPEKGLQLSDTYWVENLRKPVLFSQTLRTSMLMDNSSFPCAILEVGPHPSLRNPVRQTVQEILGAEIPYHGTLARGVDAVTAFCHSLGFLWQHFHNPCAGPQDSRILKLDEFQRTVGGGVGVKDNYQKYEVSTNLPPYQWNHETSYWAESRVSRRFRLRPESLHPLLGHFDPDSSAHHLCWRNRLRTLQQDNGEDHWDSFWVEGHYIEGQAIVPAAGYVSTALEAARVLPSAAATLSPSSVWKQSQLQLHLVEIQDLVIHQAIILAPDNEDGVEVLIDLTDITFVGPGLRVRSRFTYSAALGRSDGALTLVCSAQLEVTLGICEPAAPQLPVQSAETAHMLEVDSELFYTSLASLGYTYQNRYKPKRQLRRKHGRATSSIESSGNKRDDSPILIAPADLDAAFQTLLLAYSYPGDCQMRTLHLPSEIGSIRIDPTLCGKVFHSARSSDEAEKTDHVKNIAVDAVVTHYHQKGATSLDPGGFTGDVTIFDTASSRAAVQLQGIKVIPFGDDNTESNDRMLFTKMQLVDMTYDGAAAAQTNGIECAETRIARDALERLATFYLREFDSFVSEDDALRLDNNTSAMAYYLQYARHTLSAKSPEQLMDAYDDIQRAVKLIAALPDVDIMTLVGESLPQVARGGTTILEILRETNILDRFYEQGFATAPSARWQAKIVKQLADRNPHLKIIEVGAGTGGTTKRIFENIGHNFRSYTFTDVSAGFFGTASSALSHFSDRMLFKTLDLESDPCSQGFGEFSYDVVVASFVLHATTSIRRTLANVRSLLRPGGFLVVGEGSMNSPLLSFIFGPLSGWWVGRDDEGRVHSPAIPAARWHQLLLETGFSGIDTRSPVSWEDDLGVFLFASQAVDDTVRLLRRPSLCNPNSTNQVKNIVVIGGQSVETKLLGENLQGFYQGMGIGVCIFPSLTDVDYGAGMLNATPAVPIISIVDLDKPIMENPNEEDFIAFRRMLEPGRTILWVTGSRLSKTPFSNMVVGFGRTAMNEIAGLRIQHLDFKSPFAPSAVEIISETMLRLALTPTLARNRSKGDILWVDEPEIFVDDKGKHQVPRLMPLPELNSRYNSRHRYASEPIAITDTVVSFRCDQRGAITLEKVQLSTSEARKHSACQTGNTSRLRVTHAVLPAIRTSLGYRFLIIGLDERKTRHLALVTSITSVMAVWAGSMVAVPDFCMSEDSLLSTLAAQLVASEVITPLHPGQTILVHDATSTFVRAIHAQASQRGVNAVFSANENLSVHITSVPGVEIIPLQSYLSNANLWRILPAKSKIDSFVSLASKGDRGKTEKAIMKSLPTHCRRETAGSLYTWVYGNTDTSETGNANKILHKALETARNALDISGEGFETISLRNLVSDVPLCDIGDGVLRVVDLTGSTEVPVRITRLDTNKSFLKPGRTYWIVGLSGALGVSLCDWMIDVGACHIVVSSRSPALEPSWIEAHYRRGANVIVMPCDITNYEALAAVHADIRDKHPPVAGVLNGAMVLRDVVIGNMTFSQFCDVQGPKVTGSLHLDRIFSSPEVSLDFFILLSSINFTIGNPGQANYAAANAFQCSLASNRRQRGLPGVALNVGAIIGAGYLQRTDTRKLGLTVSRGGLMHLSEEDFHQIVAEGILASQPQHGNSYDDNVYELTTGLLTFPHDTIDPPIWFSDPKFTHLIVTHGDQAADSGGVFVSDGKVKENAGRITVSIFQDQLRASTKIDELESVAKRAFAAQLRYILQSKSASDDELLMMYSDELGIDSLTSVDIRNWFLRFMAVSIPVLRIMSKTTMSSLLQHAIEKIPAEMVPQMPRGPRGSVEVERNRTPQPTGGDRTHQASNPPVVARPMAARALIDWDTETLPPTVPDDLRALLQSHPTYTQAAVFPPRKIILTGVTGLLGRHLLKHLLQATPSTTEIVSIAVRQLQTSNLRTFLANLPPEISAAVSSGRVSFLPGDLSQPRLGLTPTDCAAAFANVDAIVHAGADTSHIKPYSALRNSNVASTAELICLCEARRGVALHFVSSAGVGLFPIRDDNREVEELLPAQAPGTPPTTDGEGILANSGYTASKWAGERLLERVGAMGKLRIWIHRPSTILRLGADARDKQGSFDWLNQLVVYARALEAVPQVKYVKGALDLVHVKTVCDTIVQYVLQSGCLDGKMVSYVHEVGDAVVPLDKMEDLLNLRLYDSHVNGENIIQKLPMRDWIDLAVSRGLYPAVALLIETMDSPETPPFVRLRKGTSFD